MALEISHRNENPSAYIYSPALRDLMRKQTTFVITAIVSVALYNVKTTNAQGNMSAASGANMTKSNMTAAGAAKNMTSAMSNIGKAMN